MPFVLKAISSGLFLVQIQKTNHKTAVDTSKPVDNVYSLTSSPVFPTINILVPSVLKATPLGCVSCADTENESTKLAVDTSKAVDNVYSFTSCH